MNSKNTPVNAVLMALVGILIGFIGGYWIGQGRTSAMAGNTTMGGQMATTTGTCPHDLNPEDRWILAGYRCPATEDVQALLVDCHCALAHSIHDLVKAELQAGKTGDEIRAALEGQYGDRLKLLGQK